MIGLIIAAGKQKRFNSDIPKALVEYKNEVLVNRNIKILNNYCTKTYVVVSNSNYSLFKEYVDEDCLLNIGESGKGSGDAIYEALKTLDLDANEDVLICWGDAILNDRLFKHLPDTRSIYNVYIPATIEEEPYVQLKDNKVYFKKYDDNITKGYHDSSVFIGNPSIIYIYCLLFRSKFLLDGEYKHIHGNEFEFLDIFNDTTLEYQVIKIEEDDNNLSFNTLEELENIKEKG